MNAQAARPSMVDMRAIAWLAGILEGEGCFFHGVSNVSRATPRILISLQMTDRDVMERAAALLGVPCRSWRAYRNRKPTYRAIVYGHRAAAWMMTVWSLMGERRRAKIEECLAVWKSMRSCVRKSRLVSA